VISETCGAIAKKGITKESLNGGRREVPKLRNKEGNTGGLSWGGTFAGSEGNSMVTARVIPNDSLRKEKPPPKKHKKDVPIKGADLKGKGKAIKAEKGKRIMRRDPVPLSGAKRSPKKSLAGPSPKDQERRKPLLEKKQNKQDSQHRKKISDTPKQDGLGNLPKRESVGG